MARKKKRAVALRPPPGLYDPALDAAQGATQRGFDDYRDDVLRDFGEGYSGGRVGRDYQLAREDLQRGRTRGFFDLNRTLGRGREDYSRAVTGLGRDYQRLGRRQAEGARRSGIVGGGLGAVSARVRSANQAWDRQPLDTGFKRLDQDVRTDRGRLVEDTDLGLGRLALGYGRQVEDAKTGLYRAGRENEQFGLDTNASRVFAATQAGWDPFQGERDRFAAAQSRVAGAEAQALRRARRRRPRGGLVGRVVNTTYGANF